MINDDQTKLLFVDLALGKCRMGGSTLHLVHQSVGGNTPDLEDAQILKDFFCVIQSLSEDNKILAYHDRSDGGLITTLLEMSFAGHCGLIININKVSAEDISTFLFNEELGVIIQLQVMI